MKPEITILSAEDYKKYKEEYKKDNPHFDYDREPMLIPKDYLKPYSRCITTTRDVKDDRIGLLCIGLDNQFYFRKIEDTSVAFFKPVIKNISHYKKIFNCDKNFYYDDFYYGYYPFDYNYYKNTKRFNKEVKNNRVIKTGKVYTIGSEEYEEFMFLNYNLGYNELLKDIKENLKINKDFGVNDVYSTMSKNIMFNRKTKKIKGLFKKHEVEVEETIYMRTSRICYYYNKKDDIVVSRDGIITTTPFTLDNQYYGNFDNTYFKTFLDEKFSKEMLPIDDYFIEKSMEQLNMDDETKVIFETLAKYEEVEKINNHSTAYILMYIKEKYNDLSNETYEKLSIALLKYISLIENNYIYKVFREAKREFLEEEYNIKKANEFDDLKDKYDRMVQVDRYEEIAKDFSNIPEETLIENIYRKYPYLSNDDLNKVLIKINNKK